MTDEIQDDIEELASFLTEDSRFLPERRRENRRYGSRVFHVSHVAHGQPPRQGERRRTKRLIVTGRAHVVGK